MGETSDLFTLSRSISHQLHRASQVAAERFSRGAPDALSLRQYSVLAAIADKPGASQSALVRAASVDRSTLADMLKRLEAMGLIHKEASASDARAKAVALTKEGQRVLADAARDAHRADQAVLDVVPKGKRKSFQAALLALTEKLDLLEKKEREERKKKKRKREAAAAKR